MTIDRVPDRSVPDGGLPTVRRTTELDGMLVDVAKSIVDDTRVTVNVSQDVHVTTREKIYIALTKSLPSYVGVGSVIGPLGIFLAVFVGIVTANFRDVFGVKREMWEALFVIAAIASFVWFIHSMIRYFKRKSIDDVVNAILRESKESD